VVKGRSGSDMKADHINALQKALSRQNRAQRGIGYIECYIG
jgi:hypothetical protein